MALTNAERQARYRRRNRDAGVDPDVAQRPMTERLSTVVSLPAKRALEQRMAAWRGATQRQALEEAILAAEAALLDSLVQGDRVRYWQTADATSDEAAARRSRRVARRFRG